MVRRGCRQPGLGGRASPTLTAASQSGTVALSWTPVPYATGYSVGRSATSGGPYTTLASGLAGGPYIDGSGTSGTTYYYVVNAAGLPVTAGQSNQACATPGATYTPVNLAQAFDVTGIEPNGWPFAGPGFDGYGYAYSSALTGSAIAWGGVKFPLGRAGVPDAVADAGQRIYLPAGSYTHLLLLGAYLGGGPTSTGTFQPTLTYADDSRAVLSQGMTNWCGTASQAGESNAATYSYRDDAGRQPVGDVLHPRLLDPDQPGQGGGVPGPAEHGPVPPAGDGAGWAEPLGPDAGPISGAGAVPGLPERPVHPDAADRRQPGAVPRVRPAARGDAALGLRLLQWHRPVLHHLPARRQPGDLHGHTVQPGAAVWASGTYGDGVTSLTLTNAPEVQLLSGSTVVWQKP